MQLPTGKALTVCGAADVFLDALGKPNTVRNYGIGVGKTAERLGEGRPLATVTDEEIGEPLELLWGTAAVNTWNSRRAVVMPWLGWYGERGSGVPASRPGRSGWRCWAPRPRRARLRGRLGGHHPHHRPAWPDGPAVGSGEPPAGRVAGSSARSARPGSVSGPGAPAGRPVNAPPPPHP
ncbi:hypothetical protein STAN_7012 [Streptomyces sp. CBMAI 2042]|nr:hypothetical protein STAN_7012 [Streptomyces sp. CBMAI 2042]